ncbi:MAG: glycosyltransferase family 39 protein, partial [Anaerolineae bacterium]|nr:glycosyltransferase family 39 protein [Gemmatimonadaceae bacterium]
MQLRLIRASHLPIAAVLAASALCAWAVFVHLVPAAGTFRWDEGAHAMQGLLIAHDLRANDWLAFLYDSYGQVYWPPVHSWLTAAAFLVAGPSETSARAVSVLAYAILAPVLCVAGRYVVSTRPENSEQTVFRPPATGLIAAALALTSPTFLTHAAQAMLESTGLLALGVAFLCFFRTSRPSVRPTDYTLLGVAVVVAYFVKTNYGLLLFLALGLFLSVEAVVRPGRVTRRQMAYAIVPMVIVWVVWFAYPPKIVSTWQTLVNQPWN